MQTRITILAVEARVFKNAKGVETTTFIAQCIVHGEKIEVGVCRIRENLVPDYVQGNPVAPKPGDYLAEYGLAVHWETKELQGVLKKLTPVGTSAAASVKEVTSKA